MTELNVTITHNGKKVADLNRRLIAQKGFNQEQVDKIIALHQHKLDLFDKIRGTDDKAALKELGEAVTENEFKLQDAWGFPRDINFHPFWEMPKCTCPKMDNYDAMGTPYHVYRQDCPFHGFELKE